MSIISNQIKYNKLNYTHPSYQLEKIFPINGQTTTTLTASNNPEFTFSIPAKAINLSKSFLNFKLNPLAAAGGISNFIPLDLLPIKSIELTSRSGIKLVDIQDTLANYTKIIHKYEMKMDDYLSTDSLSGATSAVFWGTSRGLHISNALTGANLRNNGQSASVNYLEPKYFAISAAASRGLISYKYPMYYLRNTLFSVDKSINFNEILTFKITFHNAIKTNFRATSTSNPTTTPASGLNVDVSDVYFYLATEQNQDVIKDLQQKTMSDKGLNILCPYVWSYTTPQTTTSQNALLPSISKGQGKTLLKIYHSVFLTADTLNNIYDHSNVAAVNQLGQKVVNFNTYLNDVQRQPFRVNCLDYEDYLLLNDRLSWTPIINSNIYAHNWAWLEEFTDTDPSYNDQDNLIQGLDLNNTTYKWRFEATTANLALTHFTFLITQREITINKNGITII